MPSLGEAPSGGARAFCLLLRFSKVSRRKGGTHSGRYLNNGYVLIPTRAKGRPTGRHGSKLPRHRSVELPIKLCRYPWLSEASHLPHSVASAIRTGCQSASCLASTAICSGPIPQQPPKWLGRG